MLTSVIVEDEHHAQTLLSNILDQYCQGVHLQGIADSVTKGLQLIEEKEPDIVFLDIQLLDGTAFELLDNTSFSSCKIIFTTACKDHALEAFSYEAIDYLLKPYGPQDVVRAVERVRSRQQNQKLFNDFEKISSDKKSETRKLSLSTQNGIIRFEVDKIFQIEANGPYSFVHLEDGQNNLVCKPLKYLEEKLASFNFFRVHASHLVNMDHIKSFKREDGGFAEFVDGTIVPVARRRRSAFLELLL